MSKPRAVVDVGKCNPEACPEGICAALQVCEKRILRQDAPYEVPYTTASLCQSCFDCVKACPLQAIAKVAL